MFWFFWLVCICYRCFNLCFLDIWLGHLTLSALCVWDVYLPWVGIPHGLYGGTAEVGYTPHKILYTELFSLASCFFTLLLLQTILFCFKFALTLLCFCLRIMKTKICPILNSPNDYEDKKGENKMGADIFLYNVCDLLYFDLD